MSWSIFTDGRLVERGDDTTQTVKTYDATGVVISSRAYTPTEIAAAQAAQQDAAVATTKTGVTGKLANEVGKGGALQTNIGSNTDPAWTPGTPLTLHGFKAMTDAQLAALNTAQVAELLNRLAPILLNIAVAARRAGIVALDAYDPTDSSE